MPRSRSYCSFTGAQSIGRNLAITNSRYSMDEHWLAGRADVEQTLSDPGWKNRTVMVLDLTRDLDLIQGNVRYENR